MPEPVSESHFKVEGSGNQQLQKSLSIPDQSVNHTQYYVR